VKKAFGALVFAGSLLYSVSPAAAETATMTFTSWGDNMMGRWYVNPYAADINGVLTQVICDDYNDDSYLNETWTANVYSITDTSNTRNTQKWGLSAAQQLQDYTEAAWLATQLVSATDPVVQGELSYALWSVFDSSAMPELTSYSAAYGEAAEDYLAQAQSLYQSGQINLQQFSNVTIYSPNMSYPITCSGGPCSTAPPQEFLVVRMLEAPTAILLIANLLAMLGIVTVFRSRFRRRAN
jgi:hypothetical protein